MANRILGMARAVLLALAMMALRSPPLVADPSAAPDDGALTAYYPKTAMAAGVLGVAKIDCAADEHLVLRDCKLSSEFPLGWGFGQAALDMAAKSPGLAGVTAPITPQRFVTTVHFTSHPFDITPNLLVPRHLTIDAGVRSPPSWVLMSKAYPAEARTAGLGGYVQLGCKVTLAGGLVDCAVDQETPPGHGFGDAALSLAPAYRMWPKMVDGAPIDAEPVVVPIEFSTAPSNGPVVLDVLPASNPATDCALISKKDQARFYPARAQRMGIEGVSKIACRMDVATGQPKSCTWMDETPMGFGFGPAAAKLGCLTALKPAPESAGEVIVTIPMRFKVPAR